MLGAVLARVRTSDLGGDCLNWKCIIFSLQRTYPSDSATEVRFIASESFGTDRDAIFNTEVLLHLGLCLGPEPLVGMMMMRQSRQKYATGVVEDLAT